MKSLALGHYNLWRLFIIGLILFSTSCASVTSRTSDEPRAPKNWSVGLMSGATLSTLKDIPNCHNPRLTRENVSSPLSEFVADPFLVKEGDLWYLFFELFNKARERGEIGVASSKDLCEWSYRGVVLSEPFHLSYPYVFKVNNDYYMVPESRQNREIRLYKATKFPNSWRMERVLKRGNYSDPSLVFYQNKWWIFANLAPYGLAVFSSPSLDRKFIEHKQSPLYLGDSSRARPAGRILNIDGELYRFVQDNRGGYGRSVRMFRVSVLNQEEIREELVSPDPILSGTGSGWNGFGMHHISPERLADGTWVAAVDGNHE
jgi:hypothetical protein